jgi:hypothetical protein
MGWTYVEEDSGSCMKFQHHQSGVEIWLSMLRPFGMIQWRREGAVDVGFHN